MHAHFFVSILPVCFVVIAFVVVVVVIVVIVVRPLGGQSKTSLVQDGKDGDFIIRESANRVSGK